MTLRDRQHTATGIYLWNIDFAGYYADPEALCQVFHICSDDGQGGMAKYSFLCPNGTIFNQGYFICDWWFNVDCSEAEALAEAKNADVLAARDAIDAAASENVETGKWKFGFKIRPLDGDFLHINNSSFFFFENIADFKTETYL